jgi:hypothetical protein
VAVLGLELTVQPLTKIPEPSNIKGSEFMTQSATPSAQHVLSDLVNYAQGYGEILKVREVLEVMLEEMQTSGQILGYVVTPLSMRVLGVLLTTPRELHNSLKNIAALTEPLMVLTTDAVTVTCAVTFPDDTEEDL